MRNSGLRNPATNALICFAMFYVALNVSDLDRSVAFYRDMAGLELVEQNATGEAFLTSTSPSGARSQMSSKAIFEAPRYSSSAGPDFQPHAHAAHLGRHRRGLIQPFMA